MHSWPLASRRTLLLAGVALAGGCSDKGPGETDALTQIAQRIRAGFALGTKRLDNLTLKETRRLGDGRYEVLVDYDVVSTVPEIDLSGTVGRAGARESTRDEKYFFRRSGGAWILE